MSTKLQNEFLLLKQICKVGGLDSRDQSRSRTSIVSRLTFENRRDYPSCWDQLFFISVEIFKIEIFQSRLWRVEIFVEIVETRRDCRDLLRRVEIFKMQSRFVKTLSRFVEKSQHCRGLLSLKMMKSLDELRNLNKKIQSTSRSRSRQTVKKRRNFQISTKFSISIKIFWSGRWCRDEIKISWSRLRYLDRRDLLFDTVEIFSTVETHSLTTSRSRVSIETTSRQIETPKVTNLWFSFLVFIFQTFENFEFLKVLGKGTFGKVSKFESFPYWSFKKGF